MGNKEAMLRFKDMQAKALAGGGDAKKAAQHEKGKLTARERINLFVEEGSFVENGTYITGRADKFGLDKTKFPGDGVVSGSGKVDGRQVFLSSQDFTVLGGSLGEMHAERIADAQALSLKNGVPFVQINDSGGARIQEGILSLGGYGKIFKNNTLASGVVPQISVILGPCAGGAVYSPAITDFIFMVEGISNMFITGPDVIKAVTGEEISQEALGGASAHCVKSGVAHFSYKTEQECIEGVKKLLSYLPSNNMEMPPVCPNGDSPDRDISAINDIIPEVSNKAYDMRDCINQVMDLDSFFEVHAGFAKSVVVGLARLNGRTVGIFGNQPKVFAASLDIDSSDKGARFIRFCDAFNIPIITFVDVPGFLPGVKQEHGGIIRHGAKLLYAIAEATVPKIALIIRKSYGGAFIAMSAKQLGYDRTIAFPGSEIAVMGSDGAANIIFRKEINAAADPVAKRAEKIEEFKEEVMNPFIAAGYGYVDDVIDPKNTRIELIRSLEMHSRKREDRPAKKHGNIPL